MSSNGTNQSYVKSFFWPHAFKSLVIQLSSLYRMRFGSKNFSDNCLITNNWSTVGPSSSLPVQNLLALLPQFPLHSCLTSVVVLVCLVRLFLYTGISFPVIKPFSYCRYCRHNDCLVQVCCIIYASLPPSHRRVSCYTFHFCCYSVILCCSVYFCIILYCALCSKTP